MTKRPPSQRWSTWAALPLATTAVVIAGIGARLATDYVNEGCPAGPTHETGYTMMLVAAFALTPITLVFSTLSLKRGPATARVAAGIAGLLVIAMVGYLYSLAYHWDIQCSTH